MAVYIHIGPLQAPRLAGLPREVVFGVMENREPAQHDVAELMLAQSARRGHDPAHPERSPNLFDMARAARSRADHLLERDDVGVDGAQYRGHPIGSSPAVHASAAVNVVGHHPQRGRFMSTQRAMIGPVSRVGRVGREGGGVNNDVASQV